MDLQGISKRAWRARYIEAYQVISGNLTLPYNRYFFTLGGLSVDSNTFFEHGKPAPFSELDYLSRHRRFIDPEQYVSVERDRKIHRQNTAIKGPTWLLGNFDTCLEDWMQELPSGREPSIVSADLMCGIKVALPTIRSVFRTVASWSEAGRTDKTMILFNLIQNNKWRQNQGHQFLDVHSTFADHFGSYMPHMIDRFQYQNKKTTLATLIFWV